MEIFNIRHGNIPTDAVNIMRPGPWGNPFSDKEWGREGCIKLFEHWLFLNPQLVARMRAELARKDLVCCCFPKACHGDVIRRVVNGEEPMPLAADDPDLLKFLGKQGPDPIKDMVERFERLDGDYENYPDDLGIPLFFAAVVNALPALRRIVAGRPECWPKPPQETITVSKADLIEWRNDWLQAYAKGDGTDEVTPFDQYLYGRKP